MLTFYYYFIHYRLDVVLSTGLTVAGCFGAQLYLSWRSGRSRKLPVRIWSFVAILLFAGAMIAEWMARDRIEKLETLFSGFGPTYAQELTAKGHEYISLQTTADDPRYLDLIETEKRWLAANPVIADIYTFRRDAQGRLRLIVDSETDYNHNGRYDGEREQRTPIGEIYQEATPKFFSALDGHAEFESTIMPDRWGIWVSSFYPIYNRDGKVDAAVGIDYPANSWLSMIGTIRGICLLVTLVLVALLLCTSTLISLMSEEISERKAALQRMEQARESAIAASSAKSEFLAVTSHEVRTPLNAILGFANILSDTKLDAMQRRYLDTMNHAGAALMELLNSILDYTTIESGKFKLECAPWTPAMLIHEVIETMSAQAALRGLSLHFDNLLPSNLTLNGDATRIRQILMNLMGNALKFTHSGSVKVVALWKPTNTAAKSDTGRITISVIDTGLGIRAEKIPHLFQAFSQTDTSTTRTDGVTGLGLAISKRLADMMSGSLTVKSTPGKGSEFTLAFDCDVLHAAATAPVKHGPTAVPLPPCAGRALVVDDQRLNRELLKVMLRRCGIESDLAAGGPEAIELASRNSYAIIFTDLEMPDMDGFTTAERIREGEKSGKRVPIVAISAMTAKGTHERCLAAGMDDYITKPVYLPALHSTLAALLRPAGSSTPASADVPSGVS
jgi:signal transduction histidine kinase/ActR/RegA family two-component response regulator